MGKDLDNLLSEHKAKRADEKKERLLQKQANKGAPVSKKKLESGRRKKKMGKNERLAKKLAELGDKKEEEAALAAIKDVKTTGDSTEKRRQSQKVKKDEVVTSETKIKGRCFLCKRHGHSKSKCPEKFKDTTCFLCRETGHPVHMCPKMKEKVAREETYCFNCGETGHTLGKCKSPKKGNGLTFVRCFICGNSGHLQSKCPKNTNGIYPDGGSCRICESKFHFAKDCPEKGKKKKEAPAIEAEDEANKDAPAAPQEPIRAGGDDDDFTLGFTDSKGIALTDEKDIEVEVEPEAQTGRPMKNIKKGPGAKKHKLVAAAGTAKSKKAPAKTGVKKPTKKIVKF